MANGKEYTAREIQFIKDNRHLTNQKLAEKLGRSVQSIKWIKNKMKIYKKWDVST